MKAFRNFSAKANSPALVVGVSIAGRKVFGNEAALPFVQQSKFVRWVFAFRDLLKKAASEILDIAFVQALFLNQFEKPEGQLQSGIGACVGKANVNFKLFNAFFEVHSVRSLAVVVESFGNCTLPRLAKGRPAGRAAQ